MRSLPPPWQTATVIPSLITQQASVSSVFASSTRKLNLAQQHTQAMSLQHAHGQSSRAPLAERLVQQLWQHPSQPQASASQRSAMQDSHCAAPGEDSHGCTSDVSKQSQKHAQRMQMIRNHLSASEEPDNMSLESSQLDADLPARSQHCSTVARPGQQHLHSAPQIPGKGVAIHVSPCVTMRPCTSESAFDRTSSCSHGLLAAGICPGYCGCIAQLSLCLQELLSASRGLWGSDDAHPGLSPYLDGKSASCMRRGTNCQSNGSCGGS